MSATEGTSTELITSWSDTAEKVFLMVLMPYNGASISAAVYGGEIHDAMVAQGYGFTGGALKNRHFILRTKAKEMAPASFREGSASTGDADASASSPITPKKRGRPSTKTPEQKAAAAAESARKKAEKDAAKASGTPSKRGPGRPKKSAVKVEEKVDEDNEAAGEKRVGNEHGGELMELNDSDSPLTKRRKAE